jgi:hypothetical protein
MKSVESLAGHQVKSIERGGLCVPPTLVTEKFWKNMKQRDVIQGALCRNVVCRCRCLGDVGAWAGQHRVVLLAEQQQNGGIDAFYQV